MKDLTPIPAWMTVLGQFFSIPFVLYLLEFRNRAEPENGNYSHWVSRAVNTTPYWTFWSTDSDTRIVLDSHWQVLTLRTIGFPSDDNPMTQLPACPACAIAITWPPQTGWKTNDEGFWRKSWLSQLWSYN